jgi:hypothetical protein
MEQGQGHGTLGNFDRTYRAAWLEHARGAEEEAEYLFCRARALAGEAVRSGVSSVRLMDVMRRCVAELEDDHGLPLEHGFR